MDLPTIDDALTSLAEAREWMRRATYNGMDPGCASIARGWAAVASVEAQIAHGEIARNQSAAMTAAAQAVEASFTPAPEAAKPTLDLLED